MTPLTINQLIQLLQVAIGPVVLTSRIGLLIVSMTNRPVRAMDRGRQLAHQLPDLSENECAHVLEQLRIFARGADRNIICQDDALAFVQDLNQSVNAFRLEPDEWLKKK